MPSQPLTWSITPRHDIKNCYKPVGNSRRLKTETEKLAWQKEKATTTHCIAVICDISQVIINKNSSGDVIANVNFCTTTTYM